MSVADVPEFELLVDDRSRLTFAHDGQARAYLRRFAGQCIVGQFYEHRQKRSDRANRAFHACITPWAKARGWEMDALKQYLLGRVFGWHEFPDLQTGEVIRVLAEPHTSRLSVGQFVELVDRTLEIAAEDGEILLIGDEYTKAKAAAAKQAERKAMGRMGTKRRQAAHDVTGDAEARDRDGRLTGLAVERLEPETGAWRVVGAV